MIGTRVLGLWSNGSWYPGAVTKQRDRGGQPEYFVQFDDGDTAWLTLDKVQPQVAHAAAAPGGAAPFPGARVLGDWTEDSWYPGYVAEANANATLFFVQFDDGDTKWLPAVKIRPHNDRPNAAPTPQLTPGTAVSGEWSNGSWYPGVVARVNQNATMFFVQFDDGDQAWLTVDRLRFSQPAPAPGYAYGQVPAPAYGVAPPAYGQAPAAAPPVAAPRAVVDLRCAYCNTRITDHVSRCPECGAKL